jgi:glutamate N-acetyltransferase / amino-acid N-acetyltransferase
MEFDAIPRFPRGFRCAARLVGIKKEGKDLALFASDRPCAAAGVFTRNRFPGAPILVGRERLRDGRLQAVVVNSKVSNVATGEEGVARARRMGAAAATELGIDPELVLMSSTGVIGRPLPIDVIEAGLLGMSAELQEDPLVGARGIMTTDTHPKAISMAVGDAVITMVAKGSGMIEPNMATMLAYIFTDAEIDAATLNGMLRRAVHVSLNMLSVDTDTSTSDTCVLMANGAAGPVDPAAFEEALVALCTRMTEILARDGEGATKLLRITVEGAASEEDARTVARSLVNSPLIKTMAYGADPNVGRILMAVGKCFTVGLAPERLDATIKGVQVVAGGARAPFEDAVVRALLMEDPVDIGITMGLGQGRAVAWGCDLTPGYVEENAAYYSS